MPPPAERDVDDLVVRAALGEPLTDDEQRWLDADPQLQAQVAEFVEIIDLARSAPEEVASDAQIDHLWEGIAAEAFGSPGEADAPDDAPARAPAHAPARAPAPTPAPAASRRVGWLGLGAVAAAAAAAVVLVAVGPWDDTPPQPLAAAELQPVGDADVTPVAGTFVDAGQGAELRLDLGTLPEPDGAFYEVWLLDLDQGRLLSLGPVRPDGTYVLPAGTSPDDFPTVEVSVEPHDGDPTHSGASVLRGPVQA